MPKVPTWDQSVSDLPGASKTPFATPEAFGSEIGTATAAGGKAIASGLEGLGGALTQQFDEQEAIKGKTLLSDHESAVSLYRSQLERDTPPDQATTIPDKVTQFATDDWNQRRTGVAGKYQSQADSTAHNYRNRLTVDTTLQATQNKDKYSELQIDTATEKQAAAVMANPGQLPAATSAISAAVDETNVNAFEKRRMKLKYGSQLYDATMKGYTERLRVEPFNDALAQQAEDFRKNGAAAISKQLNVQDLPPTTPGVVNDKRVQQIDRTPAAPAIEDAAAKTGVDPARMKVVASIESSGNANAVTGRYKGLFQLSDAEFAKYGGGNIFDPHDNALAAARKMIAEDAEFTKSHGRPPTVTESYMMHQQGVGGAANHYAHPDAPAWQNMYATAEGRQKGAAWAKQAIWGNVPSDMKAKFGSVENVTSRDFIAMWDQKVTGAGGAPVAKGPMVEQPTVKAGAGTTTADGQQSKPIVIRNAQGQSVVVPTVSSDGFKVLSDSQAVTQFQQTGQHIGVFDQSSAASDYADRLKGAEQRAAVPRTAMLDDTAPLLGQTPKEMIARQDHWDAQLRSVDAYRKQIQEQAKTRANGDLGQEEMAVKAHGQAGVNQMWTAPALNMVLGPHDAEIALDKREANLKYNGATAGWTAMSDPQQMATDLETLNPQRINPQSAAFGQYVQNYEEASRLMIKTVEARDKAVKLRGDAEMKTLIDSARTGSVTTDMIDRAKPWLSHTELSAAYVLRDNPPVARNDAATIEIHNAIREMPPADFQRYITGWVAKNAVSKDDLKSYLDRNENYWAQGVQPPTTDAKKWLEEKMTPGVSATGPEAAIFRGKQADAIAEFKDWESNPLNKEKLKDRALVMQQVRDIFARYQTEGFNKIRFGLPPSQYFPPGIKAENVTPEVIADATRKLQADMTKTDMFGRKTFSDAEIAGRWSLLKSWKDTLPVEQEPLKPQKPTSGVQPPVPQPAVPTLH